MYAIRLFTKMKTEACSAGMEHLVRVTAISFCSYVGVLLAVVLFFAIYLMPLAVLFSSSFSPAVAFDLALLASVQMPVIPMRTS